MWLGSRNRLGGRGSCNFAIDWSCGFLGLTFDFASCFVRDDRFRFGTFGSFVKL